MSETPEYAAPAIDKALDILELLADSAGAMTQLEIATAIGRTAGQIFRPLMRLEKRGFIYRDKAGLYALSLRMFDLAHRQEPLRSLLTVAVPLMRDLSSEIGQSCNLGVLDGDKVRVVAQIDSPADFGFRVRVGALFDVAETAAGMVFTAFGDQPNPGIDEEILEGIRSTGALTLSVSAQPGILDVVVPIRRASGQPAIATLTVPYIATSYSTSGVESVRQRALHAAEEISHSLGILEAPEEQFTASISDRRGQSPAH